jgi:hypothetical protein
MLNRYIKKYQITQNPPATTAAPTPPTISPQRPSPPSPQPLPNHFLSRLSQVISEIPLIDTSALAQNPETVSWQKTVVISVVTFFFGIFVSATLFFLAY